MTVTTPRPRWDPKDYAAADADIAAGLVEEGPYLELKRQMIPDLVKQICAFSKNGGVVVIGVEEDKATGRAIRLNPVVLKGLAERIDQIAWMKVDPPMRVDVRSVPNPDDPTTGLVIVVVDPSGDAPHQVDGKYYDRIDKTIGVLSDADVERLHRLRMDRQGAVAEQARKLAAEVFADSAPHQSRFVIAVEPRPYRGTDLLRRPISGGDFADWIRLNVAAAGRDLRERRADRSKVLHWQLGEGYDFGGTAGRTPTGVQTSFDNGSGYLRVLQIDESGAVRIVVATQQRWVNNRFQFYWHDVLTQLVFAVNLARRLWGAQGARPGATIGLHIDGLDDTIPESPADQTGQASRSPYVDLHPYRQSTYQGAAQASPVELTGDLTDLLDRLVGPLMRSLGLGTVLQPPTP